MHRLHTYKCLFACTLPTIDFPPLAVVVGLSWVSRLVSPEFVACFKAFAVCFGSVNTIGQVEDSTFLGGQKPLLSWNVVGNVKRDYINLPKVICGLLDGLHCMHCLLLLHACMYGCGLCDCCCLDAYTVVIGPFRPAMASSGCWH